MTFVTFDTYFINWIKIIIIIIVIIIITSDTGKSKLQPFYTIHKASSLNLKIIWSTRVNFFGCVPFGESKNGFLIQNLSDFGFKRSAKSEIGL